MWSMKDAIKPLHPPSTPITSTTTPTLQRFNHLLLEHGEKHLQDWAVVASSSPQQLSACEALENSSVNMGSIPGRLRLCSRSVVFEPEDYSRGIIRCPLIRMGACPQLANEEGDNVVTVNCARHLVMKGNNVIAPFESVEVEVMFRFTFLHSSPSRFLELVANLYAAVHRSSSSPSPSMNISALLRPMLDRPFDPSNLLSLTETPKTGNLRCHLLSPLLSTPGCAIVTNERIYFQPCDGILSVSQKAKSWSIRDIIAVARRYSGLDDAGLEIYMREEGSVILAFETRGERERVLSLLPSEENVLRHDGSFVRKACEAWLRGEISNFEYLLALNSASGRSFHDLSRYPVVPWVLVDYSSSKLDLSKGGEGDVYRDLSKPVGALDEKRLEYFRTRLEGMQDHMDRPFLYGTHYSAPGYVLYYLVRKMPEHMLCLQNGKFDAPDRLFHCLVQTYASVLTNHADVKELIPEFYNPPSSDFLINARGLQLGSTQNNERVHDVKLPPWARSPRDFIKKNRKALESAYASEHLSKWIDLIFGVKSRGEEALKADNLFHSMAYVSAQDMKSMSAEEIAQAELQATEFGIVPDQLFAGPHPRKGGDVKINDIDWETLLVPETNHTANGVTVPVEDEVAMNDSNEKSGWDLLSDFDNLHTASGGQGSSSHLTSSSPSSHRSQANSSSSKITPTPLAQPPMISNNVIPPTTTTNKRATAFSKTKASWRSSSPLNTTPLSSSGNNQQTPPTPSARYASGTTTTKQRQEGERKAGGYYSQSSSQSLDNHRHSRNTSATTTSVSPNPLVISVDNDNGTTKTSSTPVSELKILYSQSIHGDALSAITLLLSSRTASQQKHLSYLISTGLDGALKVHTLPVEDKRRSFSGVTKSTLSRLSYLVSAMEQQQQQQRGGARRQSRLSLYRSHVGKDPLGCMSVVCDNHGGYVVFAGGHDDIVLAYGITSACQMASVYSHRDAVTGLSILHRHTFTDTTYPPSSPILLLVTGSWDATVKVWSVALSAGETTSINRDPLVELFDADSSIVCVDGVSLQRGVGIVAGCADGSFVVWCGWDGGAVEVVYKEERSGGTGSCGVVRWWKGNGGRVVLFAGFGSGRIVSYLLEEGAEGCDFNLRVVSKLNLGSAIKCLEVVRDTILVGCADGGLRAVSIIESAQFNTTPRLWKAVHGGPCAGISCISADFNKDSKGEEVLMIATGAEDGTVVLSELRDIII